jgi:D-aminoacyl-tRNA deacylase
MRVVVQRVSEASVTVEGEVIGKISRGLLVLVGIKPGDSDKEIDFLAEKLVNLRIFPDEEDKMNRSVLDIRGEILVVSQFTLYGDCRKGRRPSFIDAAHPDIAEKIYDRFVHRLKACGLNIQTGRFAAMMNVALLNSGPVTLIIDSP